MSYFSQWCPKKCISLKRKTCLNTLVVFLLSIYSFHLWFGQEGEPYQLQKLFPWVDGQAILFNFFLVPGINLTEANNCFKQNENEWLSVSHIHYIIAYPHIQEISQTYSSNIWSHWEMSWASEKNNELFETPKQTSWYKVFSLDQAS
jgi:hypothetical protein